MKKKIIYTFLLFLFILGFFNYKFFVGNFYNGIGNIYYGQEKFFLSLIYHTKAYNYNKTDKIIYNIGNDYYKINDYENSLEQYKKIIEEDSLEFERFHNLGNLFYRLGEEYLEQNIFLWEQSLSYYEEALSIEEDNTSRKNYDFVLEKLDNLKKIKEEKDNKKEEEVKEEEKDNNSSKGGNNTEDRLSKYKLNNDSDVSNLTNQEKEDLENYVKYLKAVERNNQELFNKKTLDNDSNLDMFRNDVLGDPFFDTVFDKGEEKDW